MSVVVCFKVDESVVVVGSPRGNEEREREKEALHSTPIISRDVNSD